MNKNEWHRIIGNIVVSFGEIEWITYQVWREIGMEGSIPDSFKARVDKLVGEIKRNIPKEAGFADLLIKSKELYDQRNIIAHNPMWLAQENQEESFSFDNIHYFIHSEKADKTLTRHDAKDIEQKIEQLLKLIWQNVSVFSSEKNVTSQSTRTQ